MTTSVPTVIPVHEVTKQLGKLLELALEHYQLSGDRAHLQATIKQIRWWHESMFKGAANLGHMDRAHLDELRKALERIEAREEARENG